MKTLNRIIPVQYIGILFSCLCIVSSLVAQTDVIFSSQGGVRERIIRHIESSFHTIEVMCYSFTSIPLAKSLVKAQERGVMVRVLLDTSQAGNRRSQYAYLKAHGVSVKRISGSRKGLMHNKVAIFDDTHVLTGSYNWTESTERYNDENALFSDDSMLILKYKSEFEKLWNK